MQKKITLILGLFFFATGFSNAQRDLSSNHQRVRKLVVSSNDSETANRGGCVTSPYDVSDPAYVQTIEYDSYCCTDEWDALCETQYQYFLNGCTAESPYESTDVNYITVVLNDDYCCSTEWDAQCELHYAHALYGCNASSPYGPTDPNWVLVINEDDYCCSSTWDETCQALYDAYLSGVGIIDFTTDNIAVYPNPAQSTVNIRLNNSTEIIQQVQLFDNSGVLVMNVEVGQSELNINTEQLSSGTYQIVVITNNFTLNQKLVLMK